MNTLRNKKGFTVIELLVVIAIIVILATIVLASFKPIKEGGNNSNRITSLKAFQTGLELYWSDNGYYPSAGGNGFYNFQYKTINTTTGLCTGSRPPLKFDNSTSAGFLYELIPDGYITQGDWMDPTKPPEGDHGNRFNWDPTNNCV